VHFKQGWAQGSFVEAEAEDKAESSRPRRDRCIEDSIPDFKPRDGVTVGIL